MGTQRYNCINLVFGPNHAGLRFCRLDAIVARAIVHRQGRHVMKSILTMAWTAEDPSAFDLAAKLARTFDAQLGGLEPPSYGVMSMAWADAGMGAPIGGGLAEDAEERQRVAAVKQAFESRAAGLTGEWRGG